MDESGRKLSAAEAALRDAALEYHATPSRGKIAVTPTKALADQRDLSLAYSPGVACACLAIEQDPSLAAEYTSRANLVGVVTNGTAVLGLGDIGPLAGKPVMECKGCLFRKFTGIDVFDIELAGRDPDRLVEIIAVLEPTLGGINLEDIKAPECFLIERKLRELMGIPVFHDDQHGTAIISSAALLNALELVGRKIGDVKLVASGAGAAALASAYPGQEIVFGPDYIIPKPFDSRLILRIAPAVARAAAESGVAARPVADLDAYRVSLGRFVTHTGMFMRPVFAAAKAAPKRVAYAYAEGEDDCVLRAVQTVVDDGLARPILIGRPAVVAQRAERAGLRLQAGRDFELVDPESDPRFRHYWEACHRVMAREGVTPEMAKATLRRSAGAPARRAWRRSTR